ncbi:hypothetical protein FVEN_g12913 [Fusarium venenatum]|nr:hypothetical protein FVEN_g12913 [Fusarium venenatum]
MGSWKIRDHQVRSQARFRTGLTFTFYLDHNSSTTPKCSRKAALVRTKRSFSAPGRLSIFTKASYSKSALNPIFESGEQRHILRY